MSGKFITIDGTEGSGKTTQMANIISYLQTRGKTVYQTREPGGTPLGEEIRHLLLSPNFSPNKETELLLMFAARNEHLRREIYPRLARDEWVISDRFNDATYAYQGAGRGIPRERIRALETWVQGDFEPDLSLILQLPEAVAQTRLKARGQLKDRMEQESQDFFARVAAGYRERCALPHVHAIDASGTPEQVFAQIERQLENLLAVH